jgi:hypothetical protein
VPAVLCVVLAAVAILQNQRWLAGLALALAPLFRADIVPLALPTALVLTWVAHKPLRPLRSWLGPLTLALLGTALATLHAIHREHLDAARGNLPQIQGYLMTLAAHLKHDALPWRPDWLPGALWLPVVAWLALGRTEGRLHHRWLALLPLAVLWILPSFLDFNETSLPRLQMPAAVLLCLCAAGLAEQLAVTLQPHRWPLAVLGLAWLASAWPTLPVTFHKTNAHLEDELLHASANRMAHDLEDLTRHGKQPEAPDVWLVTRTYAEGPAVGVHLHFPTYLFPGVRVVTATDWLARAPTARAPDVAWFLRSVRCWAHPVVGGDATREQDACQALVRGARGPSVLAGRIENLRDSPTFDYYGRRATLDVGLYGLVWPPEPHAPR